MMVLVITCGLVGFVVLLGLFVVAKYNGLVRARNFYRNAFSQIDVQLKRRHDLIPNLVETAKAYLSHERETLEAVIAARNSAESARSVAAADPSNAIAIKQLAGAEGSLGGTLGRLFALSEAYPDLKANQNMAQLTEELTSTENKISFARQSYNDSVMGYNNQREVFPTNIVAGMFNFGPAALFELSEAKEREPVKVQF
ncbi:LemA family protein [Luteolibacter sp. SL250]|uniref:LemA family protein n=1 Tax=Luteolibacter sp. SL250 TaxID=2995170 RepID=UPI00226F33A3|nr:LemA family protein [Luteolibacter sp. SL250]WAC17795.1 LemA family protein [Luteolibacter sp. SL250]